MKSPTEIRWVGLVGIPPLPIKIVVDFQAENRPAAATELRRLIAIDAVPDDTYLKSRLEYEADERARIAREKNLAKRRQQFRR